MRTIKVDVAIAGGGIAGLWVANLLVQRGLEVALCNPGPAGGTQTLASQGLIHGGIKYALGGHADPVFDALQDMPARWRRCLEGAGEIDLRAVPTVSQACYLWSREAFGARLAGFLASRLLRGRVARLARADYPAAFSGQTGSLYRLDDFAIDVGALCRHLSDRLGQRVLASGVPADGIVRRGRRLAAFRTAEATVEAERFVFAAGAGNAALAEAAGLDVAMQRRPLKQVLVHSPDPEALCVHCVAAFTREPALTVTTHSGHHYLGGALASEGVERCDADQIDAARAALDASLPWIDWRTRRFETLSIDRAEPATRDGRRPGGAFVAARENALVVWPIKLALAPDLGDRVLAALGP